MSRPCAALLPNGALGDAAGFVGRVVQDLNLEQFARIVDLTDGIDQPVRHVHLVIDR